MDVKQLVTGREVRIDPNLRDLDEDTKLTLIEKGLELHIANRQPNAVGAIERSVAGVSGNLFVVLHHDEEVVGDSPRFNGRPAAYFDHELLNPF